MVSYVFRAADVKILKIKAVSDEKGNGFSAICILNYKRGIVAR